ncbi:MAG: TrbI/VirB10 family protein [Sphingomonadales bacterium]|nr:TrbI/VirB10 family protein [Sphingomonadales bacterium]
MRIADHEQAPATATQVEDLSSLVLEGTMLAGVLETAINSDLPGYVRAIVSDNVWSFDGTRILVPRGSRLIGQYRSGLAIGESRAFRHLDASRPSRRRLNPPCVSGDGRARPLRPRRQGRSSLRPAVRLRDPAFGNRRRLDAAVDSSDNQVVIGSSSDAYSIAQAALQGSINIPPTVKIRQGSPIRIFAARDLYFPTQQAAVQ